ncbi:hypothetical protein RXV86_15635 [Alisedimentitalea sp. MJ-SS2]|uniref:hypothetical protein n=1 Tax=Aliisedimentitalea sp. MJ-SS2 TaxID=3049795 RepID=UPI00291131AB|nr:hypothetical protein [Alisedimentitalea sp. MJ-SS2]MDU8928824.1 hypothetical protein [Alisedimentitalea sp. MJ-SS2]
MFFVKNDELVIEFVSLCLALDRAEIKAWENATRFEDGKIVGRISKAYGEICENRDDRVDELLSHQDEVVRYWAAACNLQAQVRVQPSIRVMTEISEKSEHPTRAASAQVALLYFSRLQ